MDHQSGLRRVVVQPRMRMRGKYALRDIRNAQRQALANALMEFDFYIVIGMFPQVARVMIVRWIEDSLFPALTDLMESQRSEHFRRAIRIRRPHQQIDVSHGPVAGGVQTHRVQCRSLQRDCGHPVGTHSLIQPQQKFFRCAHAAWPCAPAGLREISSSRRDPASARCAIAMARSHALPSPPAQEAIRIRSIRGGFASATRVPGRASR